MKNIRFTGHSARTALATTALLLCAAAWKAEAQFEITTTTGNTAQNFDALQSATGTNKPWTNDTTPTAGDVTSTLDGWSLFNFAGGGTPITTYDVGPGSSTTGKFYSFGAASATDRALGGLASGGAYFGSPLTGAVAGWIAFSAINDSASALTGLTVNFDGEQWRNGGATTAPLNVPQTMSLEYGIGATFTAVPTWTAPGAAFNWTSPVFGTITAAAVDGNAAGLQAGRGGTISGVTLAAGETFWVRWVENNDTGNDHGLAIDNFTFSWLPSTTPPKNLLWTPTTAVWDAAAPNWKDTVTTNIVAFTNNDSVTFDDTGLSMNNVTVTAGGVGPAAVTVNTTGTYSFSGGPINAGAALVKDGPGMLVLGAAYSQGLNAIAGTVRTAANQVLGDSSTVTLGNGVTLDLNGNNETVGALNLTGATIATGTGLLTVGGNVTTVLSPTDTPTTISGNLSNGGTGRIYLVTDSAAPEDLILNAKLTGGGRLNFDGAGTVRIAGDNSAFTGGLQMDSGITYVLAHANALGTGQLFLNGGTVRADIPLSGAAALSAPVSLGGNGVTLEGNNLEFSGALTFFGAGVKTYTVAASQTLKFSGTLSSAGSPLPNSAMKKAGPGTLILAEDGSAYTGVFTVAEGTAVIATANALGTGSVDVTPTGVSSTLRIAVSTTIESLNIGDGGLVIFSALPPPAPEDAGFGGADLVESAGVAVPEPGAGMLLLAGLAALGGMRRGLPLQRRAE